MKSLLASVEASVRDMKPPPPSEGDVNTSPNRAAWLREEIDAETRHWLDEDARWFLHQSLSTPCLNVLQSCEASEIQDLQGRAFLDFHGNNVHHIGFSHPEVIEAITRQMRELSFCSRRYTNLPAIRLARKLAELAPGHLNRVLFARRDHGDGDGAETRSRRYRPFQNHFPVGLVPRRLTRCNINPGRGPVPAGHGTALARRAARSPSRSAWLPVELR